MPFEKRQLRPGPKRTGDLSYLRPPPAPPEQKSVRYGTEMIERVEQRALEMSLRLGRTVKFAEIARRGIELALAEPLPDYVRGPRVPCSLVRNAAGGVTCLECRMQTSRSDEVMCNRLKRKVAIADE